MKRWSRNGVIGLLVGFWLALAGAASAGPYVNLMQPCDCPPNHYSAFHVLTPIYWRWVAWCQGPCRYTFAKNRNPSTAATTHIVKYHCTTVCPLQFSFENYPGLNGSPPASSYQARTTTPSPRENPLQELPPPREEKMQPPEKLPPPSEEPNKK